VLVVADDASVASSVASHQRGKFVLPAMTYVREQKREEST
jgi:hypothetical protein